MKVRPAVTEPHHTHHPAHPPCLACGFSACLIKISAAAVGICGQRKAMKAATAMMEFVFRRSRADLPRLPSSQCFFRRRCVRNTVGCLVNFLAGGCALDSRLLGMLKVRTRKRKRERSRDVSTSSIVRLPFRECLATISHPIQALKGRLGWNGNCIHLLLASVDCGDIVTILSTQICTICVTSPHFNKSAVDSLASALLLWIKLDFFSKTLGWHHSSSTGTKTSAGLLFCF